MSGFNHQAKTVFRTFDPKIDGILGTTAWAGTSISYGFPTSNAEFSASYSSGEHNGFFATNAAQQAVIRKALDTQNGNAADDGFSVEGFTNLGIAQSFAGGAHIRVSQTTLDPFNFNTAWAFAPGTTERDGDVWLSNVAFDYSAPAPGNYPQALILHELGHALGLKHGHENSGFGALPASWDRMEYTLMTYRSYTGGPLQYRNETTGFAQSFMMLDIAALQLMYGANYTVNSGNTVYSWTPGSGVTLVDGGAAITPVSNRIFATVWDGGGIDTYDLSAYATDLQIDLAPGSHSLFSTAQRAALGDGNFAQGNIYNALTIGNDLRSLIENATGGTGDDDIAGNQTGNILRGGGGDDTLDGRSWHDTVRGEAGSDILKGGSGHDIVNGGGGRDRVSGNAGVDKVIGGNGSDRMFGNGGRDEMIGGDGHDRIAGGGGNDRLTGGRGGDTLTGNAGRDVFRFTSGGDAGTAGSEIDQITDFTLNIDSLDFSALTGEAIALRLLGSFTGTGPCIITREVAGSTRVLVDSDGDGAADMRIDLIGTLGLGAGDFDL